MSEYSTEYFKYAIISVACIDYFRQEWLCEILTITSCRKRSSKHMHKPRDVWCFYIIVRGSHKMKQYNENVVFHCIVIYFGIYICMYVLLQHGSSQGISILSINRIVYTYIHECAKKIRIFKEGLQDSIELISFKYLLKYSSCPRIRAPTNIPLSRQYCTQFSLYLQ